MIRIQQKNANIIATYQIIFLHYQYTRETSKLAKMNQSLIEKRQTPHQYLKLGCITFLLHYKEWNKFNSLINNDRMREIYLFGDKGQLKIDNIHLTCKVSQQDNLQSYCRDQFLAEIYEQTKKPTQRFEGIDKKNSISSFKFNFESASVAHHLILLQDKGIIQFYDPFVIQKNITHYDGVQYSCDYKRACFEVWINQRVLWKANKAYEDYNDLINKSDDPQFENKILEERKKYLFEHYKDQIIERSIIQVIKALSTKQRLLFYNEKEKGQEIEQSQFVASSKDQYRYQHSKELSLAQNLNQSSNEVSLNFTKGDVSDAGFYFDLNQNTPLTENPPGFQGNLKNYQKQALTWMLYREGVGKEGGMDFRHLPYWEDYGKILGLRQSLLINDELYLIAWKRRVEKKCKGGILADDMGLGKTIMTIALILANRPKNSQTLIITPLSLLKQWKLQFQRFAPSLNTYIFFQNKVEKKFLDSFDVVITTQGKARAQKRKNVSFSYVSTKKWFRIVVDEAHVFKNYETNIAKNLCSLMSECRWCLTGTPAHNSIVDLYSLVKFLKFTPWCWKQRWDKIFPKEVRKLQKVHILKSKQILRGIMLRRKKQSINFEGEKIIEIPQIDVIVQTVQLSQQGKRIYKYIDTKAQKVFEKLQTLENMINNSTVSGLLKYSMIEIKIKRVRQIFSLLNKMRMVSCHEILVDYICQYTPLKDFRRQYLLFLSKNNIRRKRKTFTHSLTQEQKTKKKILPVKKIEAEYKQTYNDWDEIIIMIEAGKKFSCLKCQQYEQVLLTPCLHTFCKPCLEEYFCQKYLTFNQQQQKRVKQIILGKQKYEIQKITLNQFQSTCPFCGEELKLKQAFKLPVGTSNNLQLKKYQPNEKILQLIKHLRAMDKNGKALVYTSFLGMMTLISISLQQQGIQFLTVKGSDRLEERHQKIVNFNKNPNIKVIVMTLKTGSVGLNMQSANLVIFMDPWWNPAIQQQAIGRVHRIGQKKQVKAIKFITQQTVQARILKLSLMKKEMSDSILDIDDIQSSKRYSKSRSELKFLLSMKQSLSEMNEMIKQECSEDEDFKDLLDLQLKLSKFSKQNFMEQLKKGMEKFNSFEQSISYESQMDAEQGSSCNL